MKQRITRDDLKQLSLTQCDNLRKIWTPERYQIALAEICLNAETEEYANVEFSIGGVRIRPNGAITIQDLRAIDGYRKQEDDEGFSEPTSFSKDQCLPLLSTGEMIEIMDNLQFKKFHFYLLAGTGITGCEVGSFRSELKDKILNEGFEKKELCDVLWEMIVTQL